jgi:hypothetical protein
MANRKEPYVGEIFNGCASREYKFVNTQIVVVSGAAWNPCGHTLLNVNGIAGIYAHISELRGRPRFMYGKGYFRYLIENEKKELNRTPVLLPKPREATRKLEELLNRPWTWWVIHNNCASFIEEILEAGGAHKSLWSNCPALESFK